MAKRSRVGEDPVVRHLSIRPRRRNRKNNKHKKQGQGPRGQFQRKKGRGNQKWYWTTTRGGVGKKEVEEIEMLVRYSLEAKSEEESISLPRMVAHQSTSRQMGEE